MKSKIIDRKNYYNLVDGFFVDKPSWRQIESIIQEFDEEQKASGGPTSALFIKQNQKTLGRPSEERILPLKKKGTKPYDLSIDITLDDDDKVRLSYKENDAEYGQGVIRFRTNLRGYPQMLMLPLQALLIGWGDATKGYQHYIHQIESENTIEGIERNIYAGITKQGWQKRLAQHISSAKNGSNRLFPAAIRNAFVNGLPSNIATIIMSVNSSYENSMIWEEEFVDEVSLAPKGLNMIPGGLKGLKFLHEHAIRVPKNYTEEDIDHAVERYQQKHPRAGYSNKAISELWKTDDYYMKAVCSRSKCLNPEQVRAIRVLNDAGYDASDIAETVNAINETQVQRVIDGKTYSRVA
jgi:hypothetical protein